MAHMEAGEQFLCFPGPGFGFFGAAQGVQWGDHSVEGVGDVPEVAVGAPQGEGLFVVLDRLGRAAGVVFDVAEGFPAHSDPARSTRL